MFDEQTLEIQDGFMSSSRCFVSSHLVTSINNGFVSRSKVAFFMNALRTFVSRIVRTFVSEWSDQSLPVKRVGKVMDRPKDSMPIDIFVT